jgi:DNA polymerase III subunit beta
VKLTILQENLAHGLSVVGRAVSSKAALPVLSNVLLRTRDAGLELTATNLEIGITHWVPAKVDEDGAITLPADLFSGIVASIPVKTSAIELELLPDDRVHLVSGRFETHIKGMAADEFPQIPSAGERPTTRVSQKVLRQALGEITFAAATEEARPILTGVLTRLEGDRMTLAAADNYRIAITTIPTLAPAEDTSIVVPARSYAELERILTDSDDPVDVILAPSRNQVVFTVDSHERTVLVSRLIDGQFPNYQQVLPKEHTTRAVVDREELLRAVRPAALLTQKTTKIVKLHVGGEGTAGISVTAVSDLGDHQSEVDAAVEGDGTTIAFNADYLTQVLQNVATEEFAIELAGPLSPGLFRPADGREYTHVVMPVRTAS